MKKRKKQKTKKILCGLPHKLLDKLHRGERREEDRASQTSKDALRVFPPRGRVTPKESGEMRPHRASRRSWS